MDFSRLTEDDMKDLDRNYHAAYCFLQRRINRREFELLKKKGKDNRNAYQEKRYHELLPVICFDESNEI